MFQVIISIDYIELRIIEESHIISLILT